MKATVKAKDVKAPIIPDYFGIGNEHTQRQSPLMKSGILDQKYLVVRLEIRQKMPSRQPALDQKDVSSSQSNDNNAYATIRKCHILALVN